jgi:hypothetical protein
MVSKIIGYVIALVGLAGLAVTSLPTLNSQIPSQLTSIVPAKYLMIGALILVILGAVFAFGGFSSSKQKAREVPIYKGKEIVGYRQA